MAKENTAKPQPPQTAPMGPARKPKSPPVANPEYTAFFMSDLPR